ncbi:hypothetical protein C1I95_25775 [Micromonospora craterilacus]|uniref:Uncharacterized protein n=1 Tax=Micromonospora craterilacus TaxID=1655439 RepID=A0A2W2EFR8_9ACTN|nr:hypothetical protein [Micromonospora craterilacus]PZG12460.1 hypothetical protein C1I95_25775 [Micromonospora craterilacus]
MNATDRIAVGATLFVGSLVVDAVLLRWAGFPVFLGAVGFLAAGLWEAGRASVRRDDPPPKTRGLP